jgi:multicomponent Na+:H+ antiporter subunit D
VSTETLLNLTLVVPLVGAVLIGLTGRAPNVRETVTLTTAVLLFGMVAWLTPSVLAGGRPAVTWGELSPGLGLGLRVEPLGMLFALVATGLWIVNSLYSIGYMRGNAEQHQTRFYVCFAVAIGSAVGLAFSSNLVTLFLFYELLTLSTYPLVTHHGTEEDMKAGRVYVGMLVGTSVCFLLFAIVWTWVLTGTTDFRAGGILHGVVQGPFIGILLALYMYGIGKAALMPLHRWLPAAMVAPTPVSALLHAVAVVKAGVFSVVKVITYTFGLGLLSSTSATQWLMIVAGATIVLASVVALQQDNLKRRLAYSTISQLSYVVLAASLFTPVALIGAALHIVVHAFGKITLFFAAGSIYTAAHKTEVSQLDGIGRRMPWTMAAFTVGALSMIGVPPTGGFISKWFIIDGALDGAHWFALVVIVVSTVLNAGYFLPIVYRAFLKPLTEHDQHHPHGEAPWPMVLALSITATLALLSFFAAGLPQALAQQIPGGTDE